MVDQPDPPLEKNISFLCMWKICQPVNVVVKNFLHARVVEIKIKLEKAELTVIIRLFLPCLDDLYSHAFSHPEQKWSIRSKSQKSVGKKISASPCNSEMKRRLKQKKKKKFNSIASCFSIRLKAKYYAIRTEFQKMALVDSHRKDSAAYLVWCDQ